MAKGFFGHGGRKGQRGGSVARMRFMSSKAFLTMKGPPGAKAHTVVAFGPRRTVLALKSYSRKSTSGLAQKVRIAVRGPLTGQEPAFSFKRAAGASSMASMRPRSIPVVVEKIRAGKVPFFRRGTVVERRSIADMIRFLRHTKGGT